jgi:hypothetical protein
MKNLVIVFMELTNNKRSLLQVVKQDAVELCCTSGLMLKDKRDNQDPAYVHLPFSLFPMPYPTESFLQACEM